MIIVPTSWTTRNIVAEIWGSPRGNRRRNIIGYVAAAGVDLVIAIKTLDRAKSRLRGAVDLGSAHQALALAIASDTVEAALASAAVRDVLVISSDHAVATAMAELGVPVNPDPLGGGGLNAALRLGFLLLRQRDPNSVIGALQSDLPALGTGTELDTAIGLSGGERAFCADRHGTGTTLLLSAVGAPLDPRFGEGSAGAHAGSGAIPVPGELPRLRCDVDTAADLEIAVGLGAGPRTIGTLRRQAS